MAFERLATEPRPRLAAPPLLAGAALALAAALAGTYGAAHLRARVIEDSAPSALNAAYLEAWLRGAPADPVYLKALGEQYVGLGRIDDAQAVAARLAALGTTAAHNAGDLLLLRCERLRAFAAQPGSAERAAHLASARAQLVAMVAGDWTVAQLQRLADEALALDAPAVAARYDERLVVADPERRAHWQREAGRRYLATGAYRSAAAAYFAAQASAAARDEARADFIAGVRALRAGNLLDEALTQGGAHLGALAQDRAALETMLDLARAANRPALVARYARALMPFVSQLAPDARGMRLAAAQAAQKNRAAQPKTERRDTWLRLAGIERFGHPHPLRADGTVIDTDYAARRLVRLVRVTAATAAPDASKSASTAASTVANGAASDDKLALSLYQAFLEANDLANAATIAAKQVRHSDAAPAWRKRLAQAQEWRNEPAAALQSWLAYAKATGDADAWRNVQRIAPMLNDDDAYVQSLVYASDAAPGDLALVDGVIAAYERLGRPADGLAFLDARAHGARREDLLRRYAGLAQRDGDSDRALATYQALQRAHPHSTEYAERSANLLYRRGEYALALAALKRAAPYAPDTDALYWRTYGQLARLLQDDADANAAYRHLLASPHAEPDDFAAMTAFYNAYPLDAARTAEREFRTTGEVRPLRDALDAFLAAHALDEAAALLESLSPAQLATAEDNPAFLAVRAEYERQRGRFDAALADLRRAVASRGASGEARAAYLWMAIDRGGDDELRAALRRWRGRSLDDQTLWGPYAAGEMRLNRPEAALRYLRRQGVANRNDPLWLLTYADAQEMAGHDARARSIRRQVWLGLLRETPPFVLPKPGEWEATQQLQGRRAQLAQAFANGDYAGRLLADLRADAPPPAADTSMRSLLGAAPGLAPLPAPGPQAAQYRRLRMAVARDVAVAWAFSRERSDVAKRWLARRYAAQLESRPNEQLAIALADKDAARVAQLLDTRTASPPAPNRIDAANFVDRQGTAQAQAFDGLDGAPDDARLHERLVDTSLFWDQSIGAAFDTAVERPLDYAQQTLSASGKLSEHYLAGVTGTQRFQHSTDARQLANVDAVDRQASLFVRRQTRDSSATAAFGRRDGLASFYTFRLDAAAGLGSPLALTGALARNAQTDATQALFVGGMKDLATGTLLWQIAPRWSLSASVEADRFYSQARSLVGTGFVQQTELDYKIRAGYPDYTLRLVGAHGGYHASGTADALLGRLVPPGAGPASAAVMPHSYTQFGAYVGFGNDLARRYTRAWRPYLDVGAVHGNTQGWSLDANLGLAGSVFGCDHAAVYFEHARAAQNGTRITRAGLRYNWLY